MLEAPARQTFRRVIVKPIFPGRHPARHFAGPPAECQLRRVPVTGGANRAYSLRRSRFPADEMQATSLSSRTSPGTETTPTDLQLMEAIRTGDEAALQSLMERYWDILVWYATAHLPRTDDAEDVAQEVFVRIWEHRKRWKPRGTAKAYIFRVARNEVISRVRHQQVKDRLRPELLRRTSATVTPIDAAAHREFQEAFEAALAEVPERRREAFVLVRTLGLQLHEAAEVMGVSRQTVANQVYEALKELRQRLDAFIP